HDGTTSVLALPAQGDAGLERRSDPHDSKRSVTQRSSVSKSDSKNLKEALGLCPLCALNARQTYKYDACDAQSHYLLCKSSPPPSQSFPRPRKTPLISSSYLMPPSQQPLRERCNVGLRVNTDRKRMRSRKTQLPTTVALFSAVPQSEKIPLALAGNSTARQFIPHLFIHSQSAPPMTLPLGDWTHILRVLPASLHHPAGSLDIPRSNLGRKSGDPQIITLYIIPDHENAALPLGRRHLMAARDFLALALPYQAAARASAVDAELHQGPDDEDLPPFEPHISADPVRVLLTGPSRVLLIIALTYIAFAARCTVKHVMQAVVDEDEDAEACELLGPDATMGLGKSDMQWLEYFAKGAF
ncbi:hypothetical protein C8F01DRAFT_268637, partial [Mycena amicta]